MANSNIVDDIRTRYAGSYITRAQRNELLDFINTRLRIEDYTVVSLCVTNVVPKRLAEQFKCWLGARTTEWDWNEVARAQGAIKVSYDMSERELDREETQIVDEETEA